MKRQWTDLEFADWTLRIVLASRSCLQGLSTKVDRGVASPKKGEGVPPSTRTFRSYDFTATLPARLAQAATSC
jgi:hypothetical protein